MKFMKWDSGPLVIPPDVTHVVVGITSAWSYAIKHAHPNVKFYMYLPHIAGACGYAAPGEPIGPQVAWNIRHYEAWLSYAFAKGKLASHDLSYRDKRILCTASPLCRDLASAARWAGYHGVWCDNADYNRDWYEATTPGSALPWCDLIFSDAIIRTRNGFPLGEIWLNTGQCWLMNPAKVNLWNVGIYLELMDGKLESTVAACETWLKTASALGVPIMLQLANPGSANAARLVAAAGSSCVTN